MKLLILAAALCLPLAAARATPDDLRTVAAMHYHQRVLLVFAPTLRDPRLIAQQRALARFAVGAAARDLVLVQVAGDRVIGARDKAARLRARFHVEPDAYRTLLIGKDGQVAETRTGPVSGDHLRQLIDAMPMRRDEMRRAHAGQGPAPR